MQPAVFKSIESKELPRFPGFLHCIGSRDTCWFQPTTWSQVGQDPKLLASPKKGTPFISLRKLSPFPELNLGISLTLNKHRPRSQLKNSKPSAHTKKTNAGLQDPTPRIVKILIPFGNVPIILNLREVKLESHQLWSPWGWWWNRECHGTKPLRGLRRHPGFLVLGQPTSQQDARKI